MQDFARSSFRDTLGNDSDALDLFVVHELHRRAIDATRRSEVDNSVCIRVLLHGFLHILVYGQEGLASSPVPTAGFSMLPHEGPFGDILHLADELASESIDDSCHRRGLALADEVEIEHALHSTRLQATVHGVSFCITRTSVA